MLWPGALVGVWVGWLTASLVPIWGVELIVGLIGLAFALTALLAWIGIKKLKQVTPPEKAIEQGREIPKALKEKVDRSVGNLITTRCDVSQDRLKEIRETLGMCENPRFETLGILTLAQNSTLCGTVTLTSSPVVSFSVSPSAWFACKRPTSTCSTSLPPSWMSSSVSPLVV